MTNDRSASSRLRAGLALALMGTAACLGLGLALSLVVSDPLLQVADALVWTGLGVLAAIPVFNVVAVLIDEWHDRDWRFGAIAVGVLLLLAYAVIDKLSR